MEDSTTLDWGPSKYGCSESDEEHIFRSEDDETTPRLRPRSHRHIAKKPVRDIQIHPPLPLICFRHEMLQINEAKTITGQSLPAFENHFGDPNHGPGEPLQDPIKTKGLVKWFIARGNKEASIRTMGCRYKSDGDEPFSISITDYLAFKSELFEEAGDTGVYCSEPPPTPSIVFDSKFESGNLSRAVRVVGREHLMTGRATEYLRSTVDDFSAPTDVHQEYDLTVRNDINTSGNIQWYYFSASSVVSYGEEPQRHYPLRVRFNLVNMRKKDSLYNYGMKPAVLSSKRSGDDWRHVGDDVCYYRNNVASADDDDECDDLVMDSKSKSKKFRYFSSLSFTYTFTEPDTVFFAHSYPYTYSDLQRYLYKLEQDSRIRDFMFRRTLCMTLAGNRCEALTIATKSRDHKEEHSRPAIVVSARVHPGESNSSYIMHGFLEFITADSPEANLLRRLFVFKIVPMLNPDGVIHGNYRCSLIGTDLNRRYDLPNDVMHPTISAMKNMLGETHRKRGVLLFLDLHGHSKNKNAFVYGSDILQQPEKVAKAAQRVFSPQEIEARRIYTRIFPKILCTISNSAEGGYFSYRDCSFAVSGSKKGTGRVISWRELGIEGAYTVEVSFCGSGNNMERKLLRKGQEKSKQQQRPPLLSASSAKGKGLRASSSSALTQWTSTTEDSSIFNNTEKSSIKKSKTQKEDVSLPEIPSAASQPVGRRSMTGARSETDSQTPPRLRRTSSGRDNMSVSEKSSAKVSDAVISALTSNANGVFTIDELLKSYQSAVHYTKEDLKNIGRDLAVAILHFANLKVDEPVPEKRIGFYSHLRRNSQDNNSSPLRRSSVKAAGGIAADGSPTHRRSSTSTARRSSLAGDHRHNHDPHVHVVDDGMLRQPLLRPSVFSPDALLSAYNSSPDEMKLPEIGVSTMNNRLVRVKTELAIRKALNAECPQFPGVEELEVDCEPEVSSDGSDSEPSVDNMPVTKLLGRRKLIDFKDGKSLISALRRASEKRRKARLAAAAKEAARREAKRLEDEKNEAAAAAAAAMARDIKVKTVTINKASAQSGKSKNTVDPTTLLPYTIKLSPDALANQPQVPIQIRTIGKGDASAKIEVRNAERGVKVPRPKRSNDDYFGYKTVTAAAATTADEGVNPQQQKKNVVSRPKTANNSTRKAQAGKAAFILVPNTASRLASAVDLSVPALLNGQLTPFQLHQQHLQKQLQQPQAAAQPQKNLHGSSSMPQLGTTDAEPAAAGTANPPAAQKPRHFLSLVSPSLNATYAYAYPQRPQAP